MTSRELDQAVREYEGLVRETARQVVAGTHPDMRGRPAVSLEAEDIEQLLRVKVYQSLLSWDPARSKKKGSRGRNPRDLYVYMCVRNKVKDIVVLKRNGDLHIEDFRRQGSSERYQSSWGNDLDWFEGRFACETSEEAFSEVEDELPELPSTLTDTERKVLLLMYEEHRQTEIARMLNLSKREVEGAVRQIRIKMADWRPSTSSAPAPPADVETTMDHPPDRSTPQPQPRHEQRSRPPAPSRRSRSRRGTTGSATAQV